MKILNFAIKMYVTYANYPPKQDFLYENSELCKGAAQNVSDSQSSLRMKYFDVYIISISFKWGQLYISILSYNLTLDDL